jgi:hypothetical protein
MGANPVAVVFTREITPGLTSLVKKLDKAVAENTSAKMGAFVVLLTDDDKAEEKLKALAEKEKLEKVILTVDNPAGPKAYKIAEDADTTVLLYTKRTIKKNFAYEKGKLTEKDAGEIAESVKDILPGPGDTPPAKKKGKK